MRHAKRSEKCVILLRVFTFDLANLWEPRQFREGLRVTPKKSEKCVILPRVFAFDVANPW